MSEISYAVSAGHGTAADIAAGVLHAGGNAVDAGVAASIALTVLHSEQVQLGGIAPMIIRMAGQGRTITIDGVGRWPSAADRRFFDTHHRGRIPVGVLRTVVPAAPDAWITALLRFGTMGFAELARPAMTLARDGFPAHEDLVSASTRFQKAYCLYAGNAAIWLPDGQPLALGQNFVQADLASTLQRLMDADLQAAKSGGRVAGLKAARAAFYKGDLAQEMARHVAGQGGWLTTEDLANHACRVDDATMAPLFGGSLLTCGPWSQGPALSQALMIYAHATRLHKPRDVLTRLHLMAEALSLAFADREAHYGDPDFVAVPMADLLSDAYAEARAQLISPDRAFGVLPPSGMAAPQLPTRPAAFAPQHLASLDTSAVAVLDAAGNVFACTPSDASTDAPVVPGLGFVISTRGNQSHTEDGHPSALAPGKRPRATACPMLYQTQDGRIIAGGGPGADLQLQTMAQVLAYHLEGQLPLSDAVAAPRIFSFSAPSTASPHLAFPGRLVVEDAVAGDVMAGLAAFGHQTLRGTGSGINRPSVCLVAGYPGSGKYEAVGDPRSQPGQRVETGVPP